MIEANSILRHLKKNNESSREIQMVKSFHSEVWFSPYYIETMEIEPESFPQIQTAVTLSRVYDWCRWYFETLKNEQWKLSRISNGHNFSLGGPIQAYNISRHSKLKAETLGKSKRPYLWTWVHDWGQIYINMLEREQRKLQRNSNGHNFSLGGPIQPHNILRQWKLNTKALAKLKRP